MSSDIGLEEFADVHCAQECRDCFNIENVGVSASTRTFEVSQTSRAVVMNAL